MRAPRPPTRSRRRCPRRSRCRRRRARARARRSHRRRPSRPRDRALGARRPRAPCPRGAPRRTPRRRRAVASDAVGDLLRVAGDHDDLHAEAVELARPRARDSGRISSSSASAPDDVVVADDVKHRRAPLSPQLDAARASAAGASSTRSRRSAGPPTATAASPTVASTPRPVSERNPDAAGTAPRARAAATIALGERDARCRTRRRPPARGARRR